MFKAYWETVLHSPLDWIILVLGLGLCAAHVRGLVGRCHGVRVFFVQDLDRYRTFLLLGTELLPLLGLLGTAFSLMNTFNTFQGVEGSEVPDLSRMVQAFAPALSTTISGLGMSILNLGLNACLWWAGLPLEKGQV